MPVTRKEAHATPPRPRRQRATKPITRLEGARVEGARIVRSPAAERSRAGAVPGPTANAKPRYTAATADKYALYQIAVQSPELDVPFLARLYKAARGRSALHFREDFCGTALLSAHWLRLGADHSAEGFDLDPEPVAWGLAHNFEDGAARETERFAASDEGAEPPPRFSVHLKDVRAPSHRPADLRVAQNFSYCVFKTRAELLEYFRAARESLAPGGVFVIDMHGGSEATEEMEEKTRLPGFTYVWDQVSFFPGTAEYTCHIHFRFPDGSELRRAFTYRWRMWYLTELKDALLEAGFASVDTYFEGDDEAGTGGNGVFRKGVRGENCLSWIAYLAALR